MTISDQPCYKAAISIQMASKAFQQSGAGAQFQLWRVLFLEPFRIAACMCIYIHGSSYVPFD